MNKKKKLNYWFCVFLLAAFVSFVGTKQINAQLPREKKLKSVLVEDMKAFLEPHGKWEMDNGQLVLPVKNGKDNKNDLWLKDDYEDFVLELDFKLDAGTNSGVFIRTTNINDPVQTGIEVQIRDDYGESPINKHFCGSVYEIKEISKNRVKAPGEWNHLKVISKGTTLMVFLNKGKVIGIDLKDWKEVGKNPDGTVNKFHTAYKDMAHKGKIGFQDHGGIVWYKNIQIKGL